MSGQGTKTTSWFSAFVLDVERAVAAGWSAIQPEITKVETEVATYAPEVVGKMAQLAVDAVTAQWGVSIPGESKFGHAVTEFIQNVESQLGFKPSQPDAGAAVQAAYHAQVAKKAAG